MKAENLFRTLIILYLIIFIFFSISVSSSLFSPPSYEIANEALLNLFEGEKKNYELLGLSSGGALIFTSLIYVLLIYSLYSLYRFKNYSRVLYIIAIILVNIDTFLYNTTEQLFLWTLFDYYLEIGIIFIEASILVMAFSSPIKEKF
jgi:hypothetical protein